MSDDPPDQFPTQNQGGSSSAMFENEKAARSANCERPETAFSLEGGFLDTPKMNGDARLFCNTAEPDIASGFEPVECTANQHKTADIATEYVGRGWNPVPVSFKSKKPIGTGWQLRVITAQNVSAHFNGHEQNIGVMMGSSSNGLTDADLDCDEAISLAPWILPKTAALFGRASRRASHRLYRTQLGETTYGATIQFEDPTTKSMLVELRIGAADENGEIKGSQTVFPGSVHETDEPITWDEVGEPAEVDGADLVRRTKLLASCCLLARYWPGKGGRHDVGLTLGGFFARASFDVPKIKQLVEAIARAACDEEWRDRVRAAADAANEFLAGKRARGLPAIKETFGELVGRKIAEWLDYKGQSEEDAPHVNGALLQSQPPADPVDLWAKFDPPTLPRGVLPDVLERFAFDRGQAMGADVAGVAVSALAVCAAAIPDKIKLKVKRHDDWLESARIWVTIVGTPSTKKSPILATAVKPLRRIDTEMARQNAAEKARYDKLPKEEKAQTDPPKQPRLLLQDTTIEAAQEVLKDSPDGVLCFQDELSGWFGSMEKYSNARAAAKDKAFWLEGYNGGPYSLHRIVRGSVFIENLSISLIGGIQPDLIRDLAKGCADDGLLQRFLPVVLAPAVEGRDEEASDVVSEYAALIRRLHEIDRPVLGGVNMPQGDFVLCFDDGAQAYRQELERKHLKLQSIESINKKLASHIGKYDGIFGRLCVIWHCVEAPQGTLPPIISEKTARRVGAFVHGFLLPHALAFYAGVLGLSSDHDSLASLAGYILAHRLEQVSNRDVQRGDRIMRGLKRGEIEAVFDQLDAMGWGNRVPPPYPTAPPRFVVSPAVHAKFAQRAATERERREREREMIHELVGGNR
jgi:hypothetical protein